MVRILIIVRGGGVQEVLADSADVEVELVDHDDDPDAGYDDDAYPLSVL
jgi:hypothetical protein